jgi:hypothetical protein
MIVKKGDYYHLISHKTGKSLGAHRTRKEAVAQEIAIKISQEKDKENSKGK